MSSRPPKRRKKGSSSLQLPVQPASITGASDSKIDSSSVASAVYGNVSTDNSKHYSIHFKNAIFTDPQAAWSKLVELGAQFGDVGSFKSLVSTDVIHDHRLTESDPIVISSSSDSGADDCDWESISDEEVYQRIVGDACGDGEGVNDISDDFVYSMVVGHKAKTSSSSGELFIRLKENGLDASSENSVGETRTDSVKHEDSAAAAGDECNDFKLKSHHKLEEPRYELFEIDLSDIVDPRVRIVTKGNINRTVDIARYQPDSTGEVTSFLDRLFEETHKHEAEHTPSPDSPSVYVVNKIKYLKGVYKIKKQYLEDTQLVFIDLSDIIPHYDGYVFVKTKHNIEIIVKIAEKDPMKTKEISAFLTETFLV